MIRIMKRIDLARDVLAYLNGDSCSTALYTWTCDHWLGEIPYGVITGDDGTLDEWLCSHCDELEDQFETELTLLRSVTLGIKKA